MARAANVRRSEEHTSELQSRVALVCRLLLEKKKISRTGPFPAWPGAETAELMHWMFSDKKARAGKFRFVLSKKIGQAASFFFYCYDDHRGVHSFPTRRSSD